MPGLSAVVRPPQTTVGEVIEVMLTRMTHYPWLTSTHRVADDGSVGVGVVTHARIGEAAVATSADGLVTAVVDGEIYDAAAATSAAALLDMWLRDGAGGLASLSGEFAALIWDRRAGAVHAITDRFGLRSLYVARPSGGFVAASEMKAVLAAPGVDTRWSNLGVAQFFSFGHFYNDATLLAGVRALPAATCATFRLSDGVYEESPYWQLPQQRSTASPAMLEEAFVAAVERRARPDERLGLSLSGGLDARSILGVMPDGRDLQSVSIGIEGSLDHKSAAELAALAGVPHHQYLLDSRFLSAFERHLRDMVRLTDGHYLDQGIVMASMPLYRDLGIDHLFRGHGGELLHMRKAYAFSLNDQALSASEAEFDAWLLKRLTGYMLGSVPADLFTIDLRALAEASLREAIDRTTTSDRPVDRVWQLFLNQRIHRETTLSMHKFGCFATIRQPYLDNDVVDVLFQLPAEQKLGDELQVALLRHRRPQFLGVTNANTGTRLGAGRARTQLARLRLRLGAKLGLKGYQPYERLGLWLRRELRDLVSTQVTSERLLDSGLFRPDPLKRVVRDHMDGTANNTFLLMALLIFGMGLELRSGSPPRS